ncbi:oxidoreductase family protein [Lentisphaerota bacterium WC36G]|nr:ecdysteroid 22-kinase family protein [Lentisphaerae bacterium WC36]
MNNYFREIILNSTGATDLFEIGIIQELWSGYGQIIRYGLVGGEFESVVVKHVKFPSQLDHPRGWNSDISHERKVKSYNVECAFYEQWSSRCHEKCRIPKCFALEKQDDEFLMVLEDLNSSGFAERCFSVGQSEIEACLSWLANFHATFLGEKPNDLWEIGTYWHLDTRPEELEDLSDMRLKRAASKIDEILNNSPFQTFLHGDAKLANFCFSSCGSEVAAVDFQYIGGGCGMKDVAYFIGSCLNENDSERHEKWLLDYYFNCLKAAIKRHNCDVDFVKLEENWRSLFPVAWTDFHRFLKGWSPGHWKINTYSERLSQEILEKIETGKLG